MGLSSSPSNTAPPQDRAHFPLVSVLDNVRAQHRLVTERFEPRSIQLVIGGSMGAMAAFQWALSYPELVERMLASCGTSKVSEHGYVFTRGVQAALEADSALRGGDYDEPPATGLRAMAHVWAGWGLSQGFYGARLYRKLGFETVDEFLTGFWEAYFLSMDANNLLSHLWTWQHGDISATPGYGGDWGRALGDIRAKAFLTPAEKDLYFPPENYAWEAEQMPNA